MFTEKELLVLARCCQREGKFLREIEEAGIPTVTDQHQVASLRAKCVSLAEELKMAEAAKSKGE